MRFRVAEHAGSNLVLKPPYAILYRDNWDDFRFKTTFSVVLHLRNNKEVPLGVVKIIARGQNGGKTEILPRFDALDSSYCSLGQSADYYRQLFELPGETGREYLAAMRDAATNSDIRREFESEAGWETSLLRFGEADNALEVGRQLVLGKSKSPGVASFEFKWGHHGGGTDVSFKFDDSGPLPGRCNVLIGYNGAGKTSLLADLALTISRAGVQDRHKLSSRLVGDDTTFGAVVAVSYSAFDTFETPEALATGLGSTGGFGYIYCGLRKVETGTSKKNSDTFELKSIAEIEAEFASALDSAGRRDKRGHLAEAFRILASEPSFGRGGVDLNNLGRGNGSGSVRRDFGKLSTGHKIVLNIVTQLAAHLRPRSLVLFDEPETHLHPPLTAALLRAVQTLLQHYDSFAIVATHSPVVVQEIPAAFVTVLDRYDNETSAQRLEIETFGESIGSITRFVFSLDSSATDYQGVLATLAEDYSIRQIEDMFDPGLSTQARALILNYMNRS